MKKEPTIKLWLPIFALTLASLSCRAANLPFLATATPTPTSTYTPSPTSTPTQTPTSTPTQTPSPTPPPTGVQIEDQPDGSTSIADYDGGYQLTMSPDWLVVPAKKEDIDAMLATLPADSELRSLVESFRDTQDSSLRAFCFNLENISLDYSPNINIGFQTDPLVSRLDADELVDLFERILPSVIPDLQIVDSGTFSNSSGVDVGFIKITWVVDLADGRSLSVRQKQVYIQTGKGVATLTLSESNDARSDLETEFDQIVDGIQLLDP